MNTHRMDQETVERLLVGPVADPLDGPEAIVRLLTAVRAAPRPYELRGEQAAVQAFRLARAGSLGVAASHPRRGVLAGLLTAKVALAALLAAATGGVALAAATGTLPDALGGDGSVPPTAAVDGQPSPTGAPGASPTPAAGSSGRPSTSAALVGLCTAYQAETGENRGRALESPKFAELVATAGGREKVPAYCDRLLDDRNGQGGPAVTATDRSDDEPTGKDSGRPDHSPSTPTTPEGARPTAPSAEQPAPTGPASR